MNKEKLMDHAIAFTKQFTEIVTTSEKTTEMILGAFQALANVMAIITIKQVGNEYAADLIAKSISIAIKQVNEARAEMGLDKQKG